MNPMVNLNMKFEKELAMERDGYRRTRRWIGDANQVQDPKWYGRAFTRISGNDQDQIESLRMVENQSFPQKASSFLSRIFNAPSTRRQTAGSES